MLLSSYRIDDAAAATVEYKRDEETVMYACYLVNVWRVVTRIIRLDISCFECELIKLFCVVSVLIDIQQNLWYKQ